MKTIEELNALKEEFNAVSAKLAELSKEELDQVTGGFIHPPIPGKKDGIKDEDLSRLSAGTAEPPRNDADGNNVSATPFKPIVSKRCPYKPCQYASKNQCPYYSDEIGDCNK